MAKDVIRAALAAGKSALDEWQSKRLFAAYGIPVPDGRAGDERGRGRRGRGARIGGKVVMKGVGADIHHKTEAGLVVLGVEGRRGRRPRPTACSKSGPAGALEAVLVEQMIASNRELMVGMKRDAVFGPVVAFGLGGVLTEALGDVALAVAPLGRRGSRRAARI